MGFNTVGTGKPDSKTIIIWAKTIYGIQHSGTGKPDPKTIGFNTVETGKPDSKTIYGQRPYMGFNTAGQGNQTQRPYMGKDHIWDSTQQDRETDSKTIEFNTVGTGKPDSKTIYGQRPYMGFNTARQGNQTQRP